MGSSRLSIDLLRALVDPASVFDIPDEVVFRSDLSREQKVDILLRWEYEAREAAAANPGTRGDGATNTASQLGQVLQALQELGLSLPATVTGKAKRDGA